MYKQVSIKLKKGLYLPQSRGQVAAQEQIRILQQATASKTEPQVPQSRGQVAAQEQYYEY
jgi:hypothetical protein